MWLFRSSQLDALSLSKKRPEAGLGGWYSPYPIRVDLPRWFEEHSPEVAFHAPVEVDILADPAGPLEFFLRNSWMRVVADQSKMWFVPKWVGDGLPDTGRPVAFRVVLAEVFTPF